VRKMSYEEFLEWADEDTLAEWVDGEVVIYSPASPRHQRISRFLLEVLGGYARAHDLGEVFPAPMQMKLERGREPDLLFVAREHLDRLEETHLDGPADVAVEIVSLESVGRDRGAKFTEYEAGHVPEYWLIDPIRERAEFYRLEKERYELVFAGREGEYRSEVIAGFWLRVEWLWQEPLPPVEDVLLDVGGEEYVRRLLERLRQRGWVAESGEAGK
ncbi:MAG TPA: Uma2 family endonuclease, partial [Anaerolineae bacterium]|nr:Uma2 family endonuclease [Anaerolineae bacterium]